MGDTDTSQDILDGVAEILAEVGTTRVLRVITKTTDPANSSNVIAVNEDYNIETFFYNYEEKFINGTTIQDGDKQALIDLKEFGLNPHLIDSIIDGTEVWQVIKVKPTEFAGIGVVAILQIRK